MGAGEGGCVAAVAGRGDGDRVKGSHRRADPDKEARERTTLEWVAVVFGTVAASTAVREEAMTAMSSRYPGVPTLGASAGGRNTGTVALSDHPRATASTSPLKDDRSWARSSGSALSWRLP